MSYKPLPILVLSILLLTGCSKPPAATPMTLVQDSPDKVNFKGPAGWKEGREAKSFTLRDPSGISIISVCSLPKGPLPLNSLFAQSWQGMSALVGQAEGKPEAVKIGGLSGLQARAEGKQEGHALSVMMTILEANDRFVSMEGIVADLDPATRLQILKDTANSLELTP